MPSPIITLTTDFGETDHFAGVMKGVILGIAPAAHLVDITHQITPFEVVEGAFSIAQTYPYFPKGTIHLAVIDPGVGSARRPILVEAAGHKFVGPDNGVFSMVFAREKCKVREITADRYFRKPVSQTFHGRDVFAPVAAHLAAGARPASFGKLIDNYLRLSITLDKPERSGKRVWTGLVIKVDRFGNMITNFSLADFPDLPGRPFTMKAGIQEVKRLASNYTEANPGEVVLIAGSTGFLELAVNQGSAAKVLGCGPGAPLDLTIW